VPSEKKRYHHDIGGLYARTAPEPFTLCLKTTCSFISLDS
jgi:hypothetical protein